MKKVITALGENKLNERLKEEKIYEIIGNDIPYQDGVIEVLKGNSSINILILSELLIGEYKIKEFIYEIKKINPNIDIIFFISQRNDELELFLKSNGISEIFYNNENTINEIIEKLYTKENKVDLENEIERLKKLLEEKNLSKSKSIVISGDFNSGKTLTTILMGFSFKKKNKVLIIDYSDNFSGLKTIFKPKTKEKVFKISKNLFLLLDNKISLDLKKEYDIILIDSPSNLESTYFLEEADKIIFLVEPNLLQIKKSSFFLEKMINKINIRSEKINILLNKNNIFSIDDEIVKNIFKEFKIIGKIKYNIKFNSYINNKFNGIIDIKEFNKIIKKLEE